MEEKQLFNNIVEALLDKKAKDIAALDISKISTIATYFIICSGTSTTHIQALADNVEEKLEKNGVRFLRKEGYNSARWILLDYGDAVVHIFHQEDREFYDLERLWRDAQRVPIEELSLV